MIRMPWPPAPDGSSRRYGRAPPAPSSVGRPSVFGTVLIDHLTGRLTLEDEADLVRHRETFERASGVALSETDSRTLIQRITSDL
jgi:uncharacterized protein DUF5753